MSSKRDKNRAKTAQPVKFKTPKHYRLSFFNENTLNRVWTIGMSRQRVIISVAAIIFAVVCVGATLIAFTPLRTLLPGYLKYTERIEYLEASAKIDSLLAIVNTNDLYLNNMNSILKGDVNGDSILAVPPSQISAESQDSLLRPTKAENEYVKYYHERENFELPTTDDTDSKRPSFAVPVRNSLVKKGKTRYDPEIILPDGKTTVYAIARSTVIDCTMDEDGIFTLILQHPDGYLSRYWGMTTVYYARGQKAGAGSAIGVIKPANGSTKTKFTFNLWHNGVPLNPTDYISF